MCNELRVGSDNGFMRLEQLVTSERKLEVVSLVRELLFNQEDRVSLRYRNTICVLINKVNSLSEQQYSTLQLFMARFEELLAAEIRKDYGDTFFAVLYRVFRPCLAVVKETNAEKFNEAAAKLTLPLEQVIFSYRH